MIDAKYWHFPQRIPDPNIRISKEVFLQEYFMWNFTEILNMKDIDWSKYPYQLNISVNNNCLYFYLRFVYETKTLEIIETLKSSHVHSWNLKMSQKQVKKEMSEKMLKMKEYLEQLGAQNIKIDGLDTEFGPYDLHIQMTGKADIPENLVELLKIHGKLAGLI